MNASYMSEFEIVRLAERERAKVIANFFRSLFASKDKSAVPAHAVPAE